MSSKQKISYLDEVTPWKWTWLIQVKVLHTWKPSNAGFGESLEIIFADKKVNIIHHLERVRFVIVAKVCSVKSYMVLLIN